MNELETMLSELESAVNSPKLYIVNYFDDVRNQIDIRCQTYLNKDDLTAEVREKAMEQQGQMISEVDLLQKQCLSNFETISLEELEQRLDILKVERSDASVRLVEKDLYFALFRRQKLMFRNQRVVFFAIEQYKKFLSKIGFNHTVPGILFGVLVIVEDEFLSDITEIQQKIE